MDEKSSGAVPSSLYDENYFLHVCEGYHEFQTSEGEYLSNRLSQAMSAAQITAGMKVLDVGCGRGEILRHTVAMGAEAYGIDYARIAVRLSRQLALKEAEQGHRVGVYQASALLLPFQDDTFDRALMLDIVEHLYPDELAVALKEALRILKPGGQLIIHTAPNVLYDRWAYPLVRWVRLLMGQGDKYPRDPRAIIPENLHVHVNEQSMFSLRRSLHQAGYTRVKSWLDTPPQHRQENPVFRFARWVLFNIPPFSWFFEREVFAVGAKPA